MKSYFPPSGPPRHRENRHFKREEDKARESGFRTALEEEVSVKEPPGGNSGAGVNGKKYPEGHGRIIKINFTYLKFLPEAILELFKKKKRKNILGIHLRYRWLTLPRQS